MSKQWRNLASWALLVTVLAACGGGGGEASNAAEESNAGASPTSGSPASGDPSQGGGSADPAAPASPDVTCALADFEADALRLVNAHRAAGATCGANGSFAPAPALALNAQLVAAAYGHARDMADNNYFSHTSQDGRSMVDRVNSSCYAWSTLGENIAAGYGSVSSVVAGWMASDGHCANLMNPRFTEFGLACALNGASTYGTYWTQNLGRP